jgi:hypothetical protein
MVPTPPSPSLVWHYPAITACICETRRPNRDEIRVVATRIWREGFAIRFGERARAASFGVRRLLVRAALVALSGTDR